MRWVHWGSFVAATLLFGASLAPSADARIAVIETKSGQTFEGEIVSEDERSVTLLISGIQTPVKRSAIKSMTLKKSSEDIYKERRAKLKDDDLEGRFTLAYDMYEMGALALAQREIRALAKKFPDSEKVERLEVVIEDAITLQQEREAATEGDSSQGGAPKTQEPRTNDAPKDTAPVAAQRAFAGLTPQELRDLQLTDPDINVIKLWELPADLNELRRLKPRVTIPRDIVNDLLENYADRQITPRSRREQDQFRQLRGYQQLPLFFQLQAREFYPEMRMTEDPPTMQQYRREVYPTYILGYFGNLFGNGAVDGLLLFNGMGDKMRTAYTDFYILNDFKMDDLAMIDRDRPSDSLLLQWGLPRDDAMYKAPDVPGWQPYFTSIDDPRYKKIADWIDSLYKTVDYGISYDVPKP